MYICLDSVENSKAFNQHSNTDDRGVGLGTESESLEETLRRFNEAAETSPPLTDFRAGAGWLTRMGCGWSRCYVPVLVGLGHF